jgi:hypothetical protein
MHALLKKPGGYKLMHTHKSGLDAAGIGKERILL